ncbi:ABC transporter permease [Salsipaludibacter albus]|uniref:ABC transporter permease n=1 Tax=Salsipaludibacter albus TaxID=2849650 RepID=UPI001EE4156C|nr:ABC transporter permease [Salsipaludibacter albus]MBY5161806.1 ABC transporter permease [Salsipaludibacter albus]
MGAPAPRHRMVLAQARLELRLLVRNGESLVVTLGIPLGILVFFGFVDVLPTDGDPVAFLVPGVLAISAMATGLVALAIQTGFERKYGVLKRLGTSPLTRGSFVLAKALAMVVLLAVQVAATVAVAVLLLDWEPTGSLAVAVVATLVGGGVFAAIGLLMAGTLTAELTLALTNALFLVLLLVSGLAFDPDALPADVAAVGSLLPSGALGNVLRAALSSPATIDWSAAAVVVGWGVVATVAAVRSFRWDG